MPPPLRLELFAELGARLARGEKLSDVLAAAKVAPEHWDESQQFWLGRMADEAARNRFALNLRHAKLMKAAEARLSAPKARLTARRGAPIDVKKAVVYAAPTPSAAPTAAARPHVARLTVEQLAAMRAELATSPEDQHAAIRQRFGLDEAATPLEEAHWQRRFVDDPALFQRYVRQFQYCRSLLQRG
jgi:hypothetical protein